MTEKAPRLPPQTPVYISKSTDSFVPSHPSGMKSRLCRLSSCIRGFAGMLLPASTLWCQLLLLLLVGGGKACISFTPPHLLVFWAGRSAWHREWMNVTAVQNSRAEVGQTVHKNWSYQVLTLFAASNTYNARCMEKWNVIISAKKPVHCLVIHVSTFGWFESKNKSAKMQTVKV